DFLREADGAPPPEIVSVLELGFNHEQQHQELIVTDIKYTLAQNPLRPTYRAEAAVEVAIDPGPMEWREFDGGVTWIGHDGSGFAFDNEGPRHRVFLEGFELASRPVTNREFIAFIEDGGYRRPDIWLSDGWHAVTSRGWQAPLYWEEVDGNWWTMTLGGFRPVSDEEPVCHVSYYEADAYARWAGARLPTEVEWEVAA